MRRPFFLNWPTHSNTHSEKLVPCRAVPLHRATGRLLCKGTQWLGNGPFLDELTFPSFFAKSITEFEEDTESGFVVVNGPEIYSFVVHLVPVAEIPLSASLPRSATSKSYAMINTTSVHLLHLLQKSRANHQWVEFYWIIISSRKGETDHVLLPKRSPPVRTNLERMWAAPEVDINMCEYAICQQLKRKSWFVFNWIFQLYLKWAFISICSLHYQILFIIRQCVFVFIYLSSYLPPFPYLSRPLTLSLSLHYVCICWMRYL